MLGSTKKLLNNAKTAINNYYLPPYTTINIATSSAVKIPLLKKSSAVVNESRFSPVILHLNILLLYSSIPISHVVHPIILNIVIIICVCWVYLFIYPIIQSLIISITPCVHYFIVVHCFGVRKYYPIRVNLDVFGECTTKLFD